MDTEDRIVRKEIEIDVTRNLVNTLEKIGVSPEDIQVFRDQIKDVEESIKHDREIQKLETLKSGRKTWRDDAWKYVAVVAVTAFVVQGINFLFANL